MSNLIDASEGENKEFAIAAISDVAVHIDDSSNTSANDTATDKYFDTQINSLTSSAFAKARAFALRPDQTVLITKINGKTLTDPYTAVKNKGIEEQFDNAIISSLTIRTTVVNTNIKLRVK